MTQASFTQQADKFDDVRLTLADPKNLGWMTSAIAPSPTDVILDVASGTGHLALALAQHAGRVVSFDMTPAMQGKAQEKARALSLANVSFALGSAEAMPFADGEFDKVTCRFAFHHFVDPDRVLREMRRVVRPAGTIAVIDMISPADEALGQSYNHFERLRDPSHTNALSDAAFKAMFARQGVHLAATHERIADVSVQRWLDLTDTEGAVRGSIIQALEGELEGGAPTGMSPSRRDDGLYFKQSWSIYMLTLSSGA